MKNISRLKPSTNFKSGKAEPVCGIYLVRGPIAGTGVYVGSSEDCYSRMKNHQTTLKRQIHGNPGLQEFSNEVGLQNLEFVLIEQCAASQLIEKESGLIEYLREYVEVLNRYEPNCSNANFTITNPRKAVKGVDVKTDEIITFKSSNDAGRAGFKQQSVCHACKGTFNSHCRKDGGTNVYKGYKWSYVE